MKYGIFKREIRSGNGEAATITFASVINPMTKDRPVELEAASAEEAAKQASDLLKLLGVQTHSLKGDYDTVGLEYFPNYFVAPFATEEAANYLTRSLIYQINCFTPVPQQP